MAHSNNLDNVIELIGIHATIRLVRLKGGREFTFPKSNNLHYMHWLVVEVGFDNAVKLCDEYQGATLKLPIEVNALLQLRNEAIKKDFIAGESKARLAQTYGCDRKLIQTILAGFGLADRSEKECTRKAEPEAAAVHKDQLQLGLVTHGEECP